MRYGVQAIAPGVYHLPLLPHALLNAYWVDGILIDAGVRTSGPALLRYLHANGLPVVAHVLTHAHPDHQGASRTVCTALGVPLWCSAEDAAAVNQRQLTTLLPALPWRYLASGLPWMDWMEALLSDGAFPVTRHLAAGDTIGSLTVIATPGHTPGHLSFWRAHDGVLFVGDVVSNTSFFHRRGNLHYPPSLLSVAPARNRQSARKLAALQPKRLCFGHGPPLDDPAPFHRFVAATTTP